MKLQPAAFLPRVRFVSIQGTQGAISPSTSVEVILYYNTRFLLWQVIMTSIKAILASGLTLPTIVIEYGQVVAVNSWDSTERGNA